LTRKNYATFFGALFFIFKKVRPLFFNKRQNLWLQTYRPVKNSKKKQVEKEKKYPLLGIFLWIGFLKFVGQFIQVFSNIFF